MNELKVQIPAELAQPLEDFFCELEPSPWMIFHATKGTPYFLHGYFEDQTAGEEAYKALQKKFKHLRPLEAEWSSYEDKQWQDAYKEHLKPWTERGLHWVPVWMKEEYAVPQGDAIFYFDAGMAFGTGSHGTTRLCARRILDYKGQRGLQGARIVDAGCGSGILAISAALMGADNLYGFDYDPDAIRISKENVAYNQLPENAIDWQCKGLPEGLEGESADLLLANILGHILMQHAEALLNAIKPGGWLVLSGILAEEAEEVRQHFAPLAKARGFTNAGDIRTDGEWSDCLWLKQ